MNKKILIGLIIFIVLACFSYYGSQARMGNFFENFLGLSFSLYFAVGYLFSFVYTIKHIFSNDKKEIMDYFAPFVVIIGFFIMCIPFYYILQEGILKDHNTNSNLSSLQSVKIPSYNIKTSNNNEFSRSSNESIEDKINDPKIERIETPEINTPKINTSPVQSVPVYNPEHYIGIYHTGYAAYVLIDSIKPMKCTVKAIGEGNTYYIYYDFSFVNNEWHFHNSQGFDGLVTDETPIEKNIINFCKSIDWKPVRTQNINSLYDDSIDLQAAKNKLQEFHINITNKLYRQAYDCLSEAFQKKVPFDGWVKGFNTTVSSTPYNITISPESNNENVVLTYELKAVDNPGGTTYYNGTATLINTPLGWKIDQIKNKLQ